MKPVSVLDIGSSKIVCLSGNSNGTDGGIDVYGIGIASYEGFEGGTFSNEESLTEAVLEAVQLAEKDSRFRIREIALSIPAPFIKAVTTQATIRINNKRHVVTQEDDEQVCAMAREKAAVEGHILIGSTSICYMVDGAETYDNPVNQRCNELTVYLSNLFVQESFLQRFERILSSMEIEISICMSATRAEGIHVIPIGERVRPAVIIDVGYTQTDVGVLENSCLTDLRTFEMGGYHFASDLAFGLDLPLEYAEQLKRRFAFLQEPLSKVDIVRMPTGVRRFDHGLVKMIVEARADDLCGMIRDAINEMDIRPDMRPAIYLTGGGLYPMHAGSEYLKKKLGMPVKRDIPSYMHELNAANYTSAFGALEEVIFNAKEAEEVPDAAENTTSGTLMDRIRNFLNKE